ncbi:HAMP domain-containing protein, partial [bacterium]|nr:HAMP domain-containing protein [bacterium]
MNRILALINLAVVAFIAGLVTFSALMLQRSTNAARARNINEVVGKINSAQQNMYQVLLSRDVKEVDALSKIIDEEMNNALSETKKAFADMPEESRKHIGEVAEKVPSFSGFKEKLKLSLLAELEAIDKSRDVVFDFLGELSKFMGSPEARSLPQSQLSMFESTTSILRAESEAEFVSARLLFSASLADYVERKKIDQQRSKELEVMFENYARIKEGIFTLRKERSFIISDTVKVLSTMKQGLEQAQSSMDVAVTAQVDRFLAMFLAVAIVFCFAFVAGLRSVVKSRIVDPILRLQNASQRLALGEFVTVDLARRGDEIGQLAENFNDMAMELQASTRRLEEQNNQLNDIFDNVQAGFCIINSSCQIQKGFTKSCTEYLGREFAAGVSIAKVLRLQARDAGNYEALVEQAFEDDLSTDLALAQIPKNFILGTRNLSIEYRVMRGGQGQIRALLLTIFDVTELSAARALAKRNAELIELATQRATVKRFAEAFSALLGEARSVFEKSHTVAGVQDQLRRILHTMKGNFFSLG